MMRSTQLAHGGIKLLEQGVVEGLREAMLVIGFTCISPDSVSSFNPHDDKMKFTRTGPGMVVTVAPVIGTDYHDMIGNSLVWIAFAASDSLLAGRGGIAQAMSNVAGQHFRDQDWEHASRTDSVRLPEGQPCYSVLLGQIRPMPFDSWATAISAACDSLAELSS